MDKLPAHGAADARHLVQLLLIGAMISATTVVLVTIGTSLFVAEEGAEQLPLSFLALAVVSMLIALCLAGIVDRLPRLRLLQGLLLAVCLLLAAARPMIDMGLPGVFYVIYIAGLSFEILADIVFWTLATDYASDRQLTRWTPLLAIAFPIGGACGGGLTALLLLVASPVESLVVVPLLCAVIIAQLTLLKALRPRRAAAEEASEELPQQEEEATPLPPEERGYISLIALMCGNVLVMSVLFHLQEYLALRLYNEAYPDPAELASFLAIVNTVIQALEVVLLLSAGRLILERASPVVRNLIFPLTTVVSLGALLASFRLPATILMNVNGNSVSNAVFEPVKTMNYTAVPRRVLGRARMLADGVFYPCGIAATAAFLMLAQEFLSVYQLTLCAFGLAVAFLTVSFILGRRIAAAQQGGQQPDPTLPSAPQPDPAPGD